MTTEHTKNDTADAKSTSNQGTGQQQTQKPPEWEQYLQKFLSVVPPVDAATLGSAEQTLKNLSDIAQKLPGQVAITWKAVIEVLQEATNIKGVEVKFKSFRQIDLKMHIMKDADVPMKRDIIGIGKIEALRLSKLIHLQAEIGENYKDLRLQIIEGLALVVSVIFVGSKQVIPLKGTAKLIRDAKGQILVEATTNVPGTDMPVTVTFPLKQIFDEVRKSGIGF